MSTLDEPRAPIQLAIFATPRSGNTWFRALIKAAYAVDEYATLHVADVPWETLPSRVVINLHHLPSDMLRSRLVNCHPIVVARHPFDTLISILHYAAQYTRSNDWVSGLGGDEDNIRGVAPTSPEFREYAHGPRAAALLSVSAAWWNEPGTIRTSYEALVADTAKELHRITAEIGTPTAIPIEDAVATCAFDVMRLRSETHAVHAWKGQPGMWKRLIPPAMARSIAEAHPHIFETLGYACDSDESLSEADALLNWYQLEAETNARDKQQIWKLVKTLREDVAAADRRADEAAHRLEANLARRQELADQLTRLDGMLKETHTSLATTQARLSVEQEQKQSAVDRLIKADTHINELHGQLIGLQGQLTQSHAKVQETHARNTGLHADLVDCQARLAESAGNAVRLAQALEIAHTQIAAMSARLTGVSPLALAVGRRLTRLTTALPFTAGHDELQPVKLYEEPKVRRDAA